MFDGVKMGAAVSLNGHALTTPIDAPEGNITDQFLRYAFPVAKLLRASNRLEVVFDMSIGTDARFMACSGGWDWAPYSDLRSGEGHQMLSRGIWKSVYLSTVPARTVAILHATPTVRFHGPYPVAPLPDPLPPGGQSHFTVNTTVHTWSAAPASGTLTVTGEWGASASVQCALPAGAGACVVPALKADGVSLWWPNGLGAQQQYNVTVSFTATDTAAAAAAAASSAVVATRRVGFKFAPLVTINDTDPAEVAAAASAIGTGNHTVMLRVNGAAMMARGANMVPMEVLEGRYVPGQHRNIVASAAAANFNTIRVCKSQCCVTPTAPRARSSLLFCNRPPPESGRRPTLCCGRQGVGGSTRWTSGSTRATSSACLGLSTCSSAPTASFPALKTRRRRRRRSGTRSAGWATTPVLRSGRVATSAVTSGTSSTSSPRRTSLVRSAPRRRRAGSRPV